MTEPKTYVVADYEEWADGDNRWHIMSVDNEPEGIVDFGHTSLMTIRGPYTDEMRAAVVAICDAINAAVRKVDR